LTVKASLIFGKRFTIFKTVLTRTSDIRLSKFSNCRQSKSNRRGSPTTSDRRYSAGPGCRPPDSSRIWPKRPGSVQTFSPESNNCDRMLPDSSGICQTLIFAFCNFFVRAKHQKIFSRNSFFLKMISSKLFYDGNHFTSKQTEHKIQ
jgi:hypothetical protein